jgi:hypothetical protein
MLSKNQPLRLICGFNPEKILKSPEIINRKCARESVDQALNGGSRRTGKNNIVDIHEHINGDSLVVKNEERGISLTRDEPELM